MAVDVSVYVPWVHGSVLTHCLNMSKLVNVALLYILRVVLSLQLYIVLFVHFAQIAECSNRNIMRFVLILRIIRFMNSIIDHIIA